MNNKHNLHELNPNNIIIRMPNWLGDLVMATPILADVRQRWPQAKITAMCQGGLGSVIQEDPHIDELLKFNRPSGWLHRQAHGDIIASLRKGNYDLGLLLTNSFSSAWWFWRGNVKNRTGFSTHCRSWLLDYPIPFPENRQTQHLVRTYKALLEPFGVSLSATAPHLYLTKEELKEAADCLSIFNITSKDIVVGINPGAAYGSAKCWLPDRFKKLTEKLLENPNIKIIYFGDKIGSPLVQDICAEFSERVINLAGKTSLRQLMAMIQSCNLFLTNDSGPMHVASALGVPLIALFGSTSDVATSPYNGGLVIHKHVACSPCYRRECPIDFRCMKEISVDEVYKSIEELVK